MTKASVLGTALFLAACATAGCGDNEGDDHVDHDAEPPPVPCPETIPDFVATPSDGLVATGREGLSAKLIDADWKPPQKGDNDWTVLFSDADGEPLEDVEIRMAQTFMPVHGHPGKYPPEIDEPGDPGVVQFNRLNMYMGGPWEVTFRIRSERAGSDVITFDVCVDD